MEADCDMFQLWLEGREGIGEEERFWFVILRDLFDIGRSDVFSWRDSRTL